MRRGLACLAVAAAALLLAVWQMWGTGAGRNSRPDKHPPLPLPGLHLSGPNDWRSALQQLASPGSRRYMVINAKNVELL